MRSKSIYYFLSILLTTTLACQMIPAESDSFGNDYVVLREKALQTQPEDIDITVEEKDNVPYGIVLDMTLKTGYTETLISFSNGYSDLLFNKGGQGIDNYDYKTLEKEAVLFVVTAKRFVEYMEPATDFPLPAEDKMIFYVLTPNGIYTSGEIDSRSYSNERVDFYNLFFPAQELISAYRGLLK